MINSCSISGNSCLIGSMSIEISIYMFSPVLVRWRCAQHSKLLRRNSLILDYYKRWET